MKYFLAKDVLLTNERKEISEADFLRIKKHKYNLIYAVEIEEQFDILLANYIEFEEEVISRSITRGLYAKYIRRFLDEDRNALNRRMTNLLSSCRLYLDHLMHGIKEIYGKGQELEHVKNLRSTEYDGSLSYRLMEALRNIVQHRGLSVISYSIAYRPTDMSDTRHVACTVTLQLVREELLNQVIAKLRPEIKDLPDKDDLKPHVRSYMEALWRIHSGVRSLLSRQYSEWENTLTTASDDFKNHIGTDTEGIPLGLDIVRTNPEPTYKMLEREGLTLDFVEHRKFLEDKNILHKNLSRCFATGQASAQIKTARTGTP